MFSKLVYGFFLRFSNNFSFYFYNLIYFQYRLILLRVINFFIQSLWHHYLFFIFIQFAILIGNYRYHKLSNINLVYKQLRIYYSSCLYFIYLFFSWFLNLLVCQTWVCSILLGLFFIVFYFQVLNILDSVKFQSLLFY